MTEQKAKGLTKLYAYKIKLIGDAEQHPVIEESDVIKLLCEWGKEDTNSEKEDMNFIAAHATHIVKRDEAEFILSEVKKWIEEGVSIGNPDEVRMLEMFRDKITELEGKKI